MKRYVLEFERPIAELENRLSELKSSPGATSHEIGNEIVFLESQLVRLRQRLFSTIGPWEQVQIARHPDRPRTMDYVTQIFKEFVPLSGDRYFRDDPAVIGGFGRLDEHEVAIVGHQKGKTAKENAARNFGMPHPEGFWKALRIMRMAAKFRVPLITFVDTPGAYPGAGAEERGQALAIAKNLMEMSVLAVPIIVINIGEGGSGGALAIGVGDRLYMLENAYYSVITPEGCASILWRDEKRAPDAAHALKLTAKHLLGFGLIDGVIKEPLGGAHRDASGAAAEVRKTLASALEELVKFKADDLVERRYAKIRGVGVYEENIRG